MFFSPCKNGTLITEEWFPHFSGQGLLEVYLCVPLAFYYILDLSFQAEILLKSHRMNAHYNAYQFEVICIFSKTSLICEADFFQHIKAYTITESIWALFKSSFKEKCFHIKKNEHFCTEVNFFVFRQSNIKYQLKWEMWEEIIG